MDLTLSDEQREVVAVYSQLFDRECGPDVVRRAEAQDGWAPSLWSRLAEAGAVDLATPVAHGGQGAGLLECALVMEQAGRRLAPVPLIEAVVLARLAARLEEGPRRVLANASANAITTVAPQPAADGYWALVPWGAVAATMVAAVDDRLVVVRRTTPARRLSELGGGAAADWCQSAEHVNVAELCAANAAAKQRGLIATESAALVASWLTGLAAGCLELAVRYTSRREAFGVPVASFQTVAHRLADLATCIDGSRLLNCEAAWNLEEAQESEPRLSSMAVTYASRTALDAATLCLHLHGGYGFMLEYDPQLFYRRAMSQTLVYRVSQHAEQLADLFDRSEGE